MAFDEAININPEDVDCLNNKGNALYELGKIDEAILIFDKVIKINPN